MRHEKIEDVTHIYVEEGETEQQVLRAIVKASFELARPIGFSRQHFDASQKMTEEVADKFINLLPHHRNVVVDMDFVQGRRCKTKLSKQNDGHFTLDNYLYEQDRGTPELMLDRAKEILASEETIGPVPGGLLSTSHMYKGESLTLRLKNYGHSRREGESDWDLRKRVFPDLYQRDPERAMEFLMGGSIVEWDEMDKTLCRALIIEGKPSHEELVRFAEGFSSDPLEMRERHQSVPFN